MSERLHQDIRYLKGVGARRAELFQKLGVTTIGALLRYYPRSYIDMLHPYAVADAPVGEPCAVTATVQSKGTPVRVRGGKTVAKVHAYDDSGTLEIVYFNNKFAPAALETGKTYVFYGRFSGNLLSRTVTNPITVKPGDADALAPQYPLTQGLSSKVVAAAVRSALDLCGDAIEETLPPSIREKYGLIGRRQAVEHIHFPKTQAEAKAAKDRLIFEELLTLQLGLSRIKSRSRSYTSVRIAGVDLAPFRGALPFPLTGAQDRCIGEISRDLAGPLPMNRLLQGDVGSGKTVVAAAGVYAAFKNGYQSAVMAPTEVLATQHAETFHKLLAPFGVRVGLLTGSVKGKARTALLQAAAAGEVDLIVGTHAVIGEGVAFQNLGFVVADEQHRFGVVQRSLLSQKGARPHMLVMSATPIPRTLALIIYGDLDISVLDELPPGRQPVKTLLVSDELRARYLGFVRKTVEEGHQAYIVCPLVEESEALENTVSASAYRDELANGPLKGLRVGLVHGRMKPKEKNEVMDAFKSRQLDVLVSTTVIEVGVDVPNATLMIIENAERFGLSALHQLRGRVGRGGGESWCVLVSSSRAQTAKDRLTVMTKTNDGFEIARHDLAARGPGDFFGKRQHGLPELHVADLAGDEKVLHGAAEAARAILESDPDLSLPQHDPLRRLVAEMFQDNETTLN